MSIWDVACILLIGGILVYYTFKEGLRQGAEHAIDEMETVSYTHLTLPTKRRV